MKTIERLTWRQLRLLDWMQAPHHDMLPLDPAIDWTQAFWKASALANLSRVCEHYSYAMCRHDLQVLRSHDLVDELVPDRWRLGSQP